LFEIYVQSLRYTGFLCHH